jgi:dihydrofolate reductase
VSSSLEHPDWANSTLLKGDAVDEVSKLKQAISGEIVVAGSVQLLRTLMEYDLVDELRVKIFPVVLGAAIASLARRAESNRCASLTVTFSVRGSPS